MGFNVYCSVTTFAMNKAENDVRTFLFEGPFRTAAKGHTYKLC